MGVGRQRQIPLESEKLALRILLECFLVTYLNNVCVGACVCGCMCVCVCVCVCVLSRDNAIDKARHGI